MTTATLGRIEVTKAQAEMLVEIIEIVLQRPKLAQELCVKAGLFHPARRRSLELFADKLDDLLGA